ncbi:ribosome hibernation-promoting factor, HPF/YfiA family [Romboutsia sp.]|uniref:ribosome hibernation-promoting factor, HPF/YfiA family n=1 Tax=Romboutsia sp. TaxID=1965302 RepID=UPI003F3860D1
MNIIISGKQMELTDGIKGAIEEKLGRLDFYLHPETEVKVTVSAKKARQKIEVTIIPISGPIIRAEDIEENLYAAIDIVYDKLNKQLRRYKNRLQDRHQKNQSIRFETVETPDVEVEEEDDFQITIERNKKFDMKPMSAEEAVLQMELIEHDFYMFRNIDTDEISIVYKRKTGGYGLIEHE